MKLLLALLLIALLLLVVLPIGMDHMVDCPACTSARAHFELELCAGFLSLMALIVVFSSSRLRLAERTSRRFLLTLSIFRPPRLT
ncbi:MAG: hypothetical protein GEU68_13285 [Actinobacteria bacterium]|nr:hypothetical protein [Actinomycetota bacterium]